MQRRYLYIMDPIAAINPNTDTTFYLMLESQSRGLNNLFCTIEDLVIFDGKGFANAQDILVNVPANKGDTHFHLGKKETIAFDDCSVIFMRKDPPIDDRFLAACMILDCHNPHHTLVFNNSQGLRLANEKLWGLHVAANFMPKTVVSSSLAVLLKASQDLDHVVLKPLFGSGGGGILAMEKADRNLRSALELLTENEKKPIMMQQYLPGARQGDKRLILLGAKPVGALLRLPSEDDHRANLHVGGVAEKIGITAKDLQIAEHLRPHLIKLGLHFVGLDIIDNKVTEINVTSPTCLQEIDRLESRMGKDKLNAQVLDYIDQLLMR
jgi:glutathione synthase